MSDKNLKRLRFHVLVCEGSSCRDRDARDVTEALRAELDHAELDAAVHLTRTRCIGRCGDSPVVVIYPQGVWYRRVTPKLARRIVHEHLAGGRVLADHVLHCMETPVAPDES